MGLYEILIIIYLVFWLLAFIDVALAKFPRWYYQLIWLLVIFLIPVGNIIYLLFGCRQVTHGGLRLLHRTYQECLYV